MRKSPMPTLKPLIVVDSNWICHRYIHALPNLDFNERGTGVVFGFFMQIMSLYKKLGSNRFMFCWDSPNNKRKQMVPSYKNKDKHSNKSLDVEQDVIISDGFRQTHEVMSYALPTVGFANNYQQDGYEADDLIASIVKNRKQPVIIVSSDEDLLQLLDTDVSMFGLRGQPKGTLYTVENFKEDHGLVPTQWAEVKAIAGCVSDRLSGVDGVGNKTATKYLLGNLGKNSVAYKRIVEGWDGIVARNRPVVTLPLDGTIKIVPVADRFSVEGFHKV